MVVFHPGVSHHYLISAFQTLGCRPIASVDHLSPENLGSADLFEEVQTGSSKIVKVGDDAAGPSHIYIHVVAASSWHCRVWRVRGQPSRSGALRVVCCCFFFFGGGGGGLGQILFFWGVGGGGGLGQILLALSSQLNAICRPDLVQGTDQFSLGQP